VGQHDQKEIEGNVSRVITGNDPTPTVSNPQAAQGELVRESNEPSPCEAVLRFNGPDWSLETSNLELCKRNIKSSRLGDNSKKMLSRHIK